MPFPGSIGTVPVANYGLFTADGIGSFTGSATESLGGVIAAVTVSGEYSLTAACTGASAFRDSLGNVAHFAFTVNANGGVIEFVQTDSGTVVSGRAQPLAPACDSTAFSGTLHVCHQRVAGFRRRVCATPTRGGSSPTERAASRARARLAQAASWKGATLSGTYSTNSSCTGTVSMSDSLGNVGPPRMTVVNDGQQVLFIYTTAGTVVAGRDTAARTPVATGR